MKLEHKKEQVVPFRKFLLRMIKYALFAFMLIAFSLGIGIFGYCYFADLSLLDGFHMSAMILTGMGPVAEMTSVPAKLFSSFYALYSGVAFLSITAVLFAPIVHRVMHVLHLESENDN